MLASTLFYTSAVQLLAHLTLLVFLFDLILRLIELESSRFHLQLISKAFCVVFHNHRLFSPPVDNFDLWYLFFTILLTIWTLFWDWHLRRTHSPSLASGSEILVGSHSLKALRPRRFRGRTTVVDTRYVQFDGSSFFAWKGPIWKKTPFGYPALGIKCFILTWSPVSTFSNRVSSVGWLMTSLKVVANNHQRKMVLP